MLTIHDDPDIPEVHLSPCQDPPLTAIHALVTFLDPSDLEVVIAQHHKPHWKEWRRELTGVRLATRSSQSSILGKLHHVTCILLSLQMERASWKEPSPIKPNHSYWTQPTICIPDVSAWLISSYIRPTWPGFTHSGACSLECSLEHSSYVEGFLCTSKHACTHKHRPQRCTHLPSFFRTTSLPMCFHIIVGGSEETISQIITASSPSLNSCGLGACLKVSFSGK